MLLSCGGLADGSGRSSDSPGASNGEGGASNGKGGAPTGESGTIENGTVTSTDGSSVAGTQGSTPAAPECDDSCTSYTAELERSPTSCVHAMPPPPDDHDNGRTPLFLEYADGTGAVKTLSRNWAEPCESGWRLTPDGSIEVCGSDCTALLDNPSGKLQLLVGCRGPAFC